jgi:hypothetical protein
VSTADEHPTGKPPEHRSHTEMRFWSKVDIGTRDECWEWIADAERHGGYGAFNLNNRSVGAHRIAWHYAKHGTVDVPPSETVIRHECHNPACCNPAHLHAGDRSDNALDSLKDGEWETALSRDEVREIRRLAEESNMTQYDIADKFNISQGMVWQIVTERQYAWVE